MAIHSTVLPETVTWAAAEAAPHGVRIVEACLTGGHVAAAEGRTTFLLGGDPDDIAALEPVLSACGETLVQAGPLGNANLLKLCLNLQTYVSHLGVAEAVRLAKDLDLPVEGLKEAMRANGQLGRMGEMFFGLHELPDSIIEDRQHPADAAHLGGHHPEGPRAHAAGRRAARTWTCRDVTWPRRSSSGPTACPDESDADATTTPDRCRPGTPTKGHTT